MDQTRKYKNKDMEKYNKLHKQVLKEIKIAKENWLAVKCLETEILVKKYDIFNLHNKIKEPAGIYKIRQSVTNTTYYSTRRKVKHMEGIYGRTLQ